MKNISKIVLIIFSLLFINCGESTVDFIQYGTITGRIVKAKSFDPIENVKVSINPSNNTVFTDSDGYFVMTDVEIGDYSVGATKEGFLTNFQPATVKADVSINVIFEMDDDTALNRPPTTPELITPEDNSQDQELEVELAWASTDPEGDPITYRLEIKNDYNNDVVSVESLTDTTYVVSDLKYGVKYFWQIATTDNINPEVLSPIFNFKTKVDPNNRYFYVRKNENGNNIIYSSGFNSTDNVLENEVALTTTSKNSWRPRRNQASNLIAYLQNENTQTHIFTMLPNGSNPQQVTSAVSVSGYDFNEIDFAWSSNGDRLLYPNYDKLYVINKDGSGLQQLYQTTDGSFITEIDWSFDESMIVLKTNDITGYNVSIFTIDMNGNILTDVLSGVSGAAGGLNISVDNNLLLYTYDVSGYENSNTRQLDTRIFLYDFSSSTSTDMSVGKTLGTNDLDPRFSPNEAQIIYVNTSNDGISSKTIEILDIGNSNDNRTEFFVDAFMPDWE